MRTWLALFVVVVAIAPGVTPAIAQESSMSLDDAIRGYESTTHMPFRGIPEDWSTHHVVYSPVAPGASAGRSVQKEPRYWLQQIRRRLSAGGIATSIAQSGADLGVRRAHRDWNMDLGLGATVGAGQFPARFSFTADGTPSCTNDFVVFNTGLAGSSTQASILAYNQLYKAPTCSGSVPASLWAFNTGGVVSLSPILSLDGSQVAFIQTVGTVANLVVLKWAAGGTAAAPMTLTSNSGYPTCTAPCMVSVPFSRSSNDLTSAPFYDYGGSDTLYVGDSLGMLHAFHPVFGGGTPVEVTTGFPLSLSTKALADPIYDSGLGLILVGDKSFSGKIHAITRSTMGVANSNTICRGAAKSGLEAPLVDPTAGQIYVTCGNDVGGGSCSGAACIRQFSETSVGGSSGTGEVIGATTDRIQAGAFDYAYLNSPDASNPTGSIYVCGNLAGAPELYRVPITSNVIGAPIAISALSTSTTASCSPVTEFFNSTTGTDWMFMGVSTGGAQTGCSGTGCVYAFDATVALTVGAAATAGLPASGGTSGLVVDNIGAATSTVANVYFSTMNNQLCATSGGTGGCAVQSTQSGLL